MHLPCHRELDFKMPEFDQFKPVYKITISCEQQPGAVKVFNVQAGKADLISRWLDNKHFNHVIIQDAPQDKPSLYDLFSDIIYKIVAWLPRG